MDGIRLGGLWRRIVAGIAALGLLVPIAPGAGWTADAADAPAPPPHRITVDGGRFVDRTTGAPFSPRGVNMIRFAGGRDAFFSPAVFDRERVSAEFAGLAALGYNTVRLFVDSCGVGPGCLTNATSRGLDGRFLDVVAEVISLAAEHGLVLVLTANDLPDGGGYREISAVDDSAAFPGYRNSDFLTASGHRAMATFWDDLLAGLADREADFGAVLGWSILNEHWLFADQPPLSMTSGTVSTATGVYDLADPDARRAMVVDGTRRLIAVTAEAIRARDPDALVTMGFFAPRFPNPTGTGAGWYTDTAPLVQDSALDFFDFHGYPGGDISVEHLAENFGVTDVKPVLMGEVGAFVDRYPTVETAGIAVQDWIARSCPVGFDGWLYWSYERLPMADDTWSFTDADGYLAEALAPRNQPDACARTLRDPNVARGRPATASATLAGSDPAFAVDGDPGTSWVSGTDAPQWIEIDLGEPADVTGVRLTVDQDPPGSTVHIVEALTLGGQRLEVHRFEGTTAWGDVLDARLATPVDDVVALRVTTTSSPSWVAWVEVEVLTG